MRLLLYGSKEFSSTVAQLARHCGHEVAGIIDDYNHGPHILGGLEDIKCSYPPSEYGVSMAIGYSSLLGRWAAWERVRAAGYQSPALIHPCAYVADTAQIGEGAMVMTGAIVDVHVVIGDLAVLWPAACINHNTEIGINTFISPGATLCGAAKIGSHCFIGAGAVIVDHCNIPDSSFIKMNSCYI